MYLRSVLLVSIIATAMLSTCSKVAEPMNITVDNLMVVLRESIGTNKPDELLKSMGTAKAKLANGKEIEINPAWFQYIGDMHIRFVFDGPSSMQNATREDLERLKLSPDEALRIAVGNIKRVYGKPSSLPWVDVMQVKGSSPDLDSSYFLDREFWQDLLTQHPEGVVAAVVKRGGLLYAPISNAKAVEGLRRSVQPLYESSENLRISSALFLFKDNKWSVYQAPKQTEVPPLQ